MPLGRYSSHCCLDSFDQNHEGHQSEQHAITSSRAPSARAIIDLEPLDQLFVVPYH